MAGSPSSDKASLLLVDECFASADTRFVSALRQVSSPKYLAGLADRWKRDARPWAREQIFRYLEEPLDCPGHQPLVKRLFKDAEARRDDELVAAFLVAFDVLLRRARRQRWRWDRATRSTLTEDFLATPRDTIPAEPRQIVVHPKTGQRIVVDKSGRRIMRGRLFTHRTRQYLRRRAWRYFRWIGYGRPADYPAAIVHALGRYRDADLEKGENILDSWALLNICFRGCEALEFHSRHLRLRPDRTLAELRAAPRFPEAWSTPAAARLLVDLVGRSRSRLVRLWAMDWFRQIRGRVTVEVAPEEILALLDHEDEPVQAFAAELFGAHGGLDKLPVTTWLRLLGTRNITALATLVDAFTRHVSHERLSLDQCVDLACAQPVPVARLGRSLLEGRTIVPAEYPRLANLAEARCGVIAGELATWALARLGAREHYQVDTVCRFFDSLSEPMRGAAWEWLVSGSVGYDDPVLWSRLAESPYEDIRLRFVDRLARRLAMPVMPTDRLVPVWCAVLLGVHRGGRQKLRAVRDIAGAIAATPEQAPKLLPVLAVAVRSVRGPEMRAGLAAVMTLLTARPELAGAVRGHLPELQFATPEAAA